MSSKYKRILLKISGEALAAGQKMGINYEYVLKVCESVKKCQQEGVQIGIVVGGGNFWRGKQNDKMDRTRADHIGMLATAMNALALQDALEQLGIQTRVQTAIPMQSVAEPYIRNRAVRHLEKGRVVIFGCGTGNPFFSTDTAMALRAAEIEADIIFKATNADGVFDKDPNKYDDAKMFDNVSFSEVLNRELGVMDMTAVALCKDTNMPVLVFNIKDPETIYRAVIGEKVGTIIN